MKSLDIYIRGSIDCPIVQPEGGHGMPRVFGRTGSVSRFIWPLLLGIPVTAQPVKKVSFPRDVAPILTAKCMNCHGKEPLMAHLDLRTRGNETFFTGCAVTGM